MKTILYSKKYNISYVFTPKVACSTLKGSLLDKPIGEAGTVHQRSLFGFPSSSDARFFAITRNPYARALSGYRDKIGKGKDENVWNAFAKKYSLDIEFTPSFYEFLTILQKDTNRKDYDRHFRPQVYTLHVNHIEYDYLGRIEKMDDVVQYLSEYGITVVTRAPHKTGSSEDYRNIITKEEEELINEIYGEDFEFFGYEMKLESTYVPAPKRNKNRQISELYQFIFWAHSFGINFETLEKFKVWYELNATNGQVQSSFALSFKKFVEDVLKVNIRWAKFECFRCDAMTILTRGRRRKHYKAKKGDIEKIVVFLKEPIFQL
ncbi:MAG: sulfotransferase family 2 domain-containing protein [Pseudomonadota bacterium]